MGEMQKNHGKQEFDFITCRDDRVQLGLMVFSNIEAFQLWKRWDLPAWGGIPTGIRCEKQFEWQDDGAVIPLIAGIHLLTAQPAPGLVYHSASGTG